MLGMIIIYELGILAHDATGAEHDHSFAMFGGTQKEKRYLVTLW